MFKKSLLLSLLILAGCDNNLNKEKATEIINLKNSENCLYISLGEDDIKYNTNTRTYSVNDKTIRISSSLESFSVAEKEGNEHYLNQLIALEQNNLVKLVANYVIPSSHGNYVSDVIGTPSPLTDVGMSKGVQYKLTKLGKSYFSTSPNSEIPRVCVGHEKVENLSLNDLPDDNGSIKATYTIKITDIPDWIETPVIRNYLPVIKENILREETKQKIATFIKVGNQYKLSTEE